MVKWGNIQALKIWASDGKKIWGTSQKFQNKWKIKCCKKSIAPAICDPNTAECKVKCSKHIQCGKHSLCFSAIQYKAENREPRLTERGNVVVWAFSTCVKANHRTEPDKVCKVTNPRFNDCECVGHKCNRIVHLSGAYVPGCPTDLIGHFIRTYGRAINL